MSFRKRTNNQTEEKSIFSSKLSFSKTKTRQNTSLIGCYQSDQVVWWGRTVTTFQGKPKRKTIWPRDDFVFHFFPGRRPPLTRTPRRRFPFGRRRFLRRHRRPATQTVTTPVSPVSEYNCYQFHLQKKKQSIHRSKAPHEPTSANSNPMQPNLSQTLT